MGGRPTWRWAYLGGEVADDVDGVATPEGGEALLRGDTGEAVDDAGVASDLARDNLRVGILGLDEQLHALNRGSRRLGDSASNTTGAEINEESGDSATLAGSRGDERAAGGRHLAVRKRVVGAVCRRVTNETCQSESTIGGNCQRGQAGQRAIFGQRDAPGEVDHWGR